MDDTRTLNLVVGGIVAIVFFICLSLFAGPIEGKNQKESNSEDNQEIEVFDERIQLKSFMKRFNDYALYNDFDYSFNSLKIEDKRFYYSFKNNITLYGTFKENGDWNQIYIDYSYPKDNIDVNDYQEFLKVISITVYGIDKTVESPKKLTNERLHNMFENLGLYQSRTPYKDTYLKQVQGDYTYWLNSFKKDEENRTLQFGIKKEKEEVVENN